MAFATPIRVGAVTSRRSHVEKRGITGLRTPLSRHAGRGRWRMVQSEIKVDSESGKTSASANGKASTSASADLDWENLGFQYRQTACYMQATWRDGKWGELEEVTEPYLRLHIGATALHYGQSCFEGLKAFARADGKIGIFRPKDNAKRLASSAERTMMPAPSEELFLEAVRRAVTLNKAFVPPYGTDGALYIRPLLFGSGPKVGLQPSDEYTFLVLVTPVGDYYKGGLAPVTAILTQDFDRAAPRGVGNVKVAGNYAADLLPQTRSKQAGYPINLYLDARNRRTIEEFGTSNFFALKGNSYITPDSPSILPSITNKTLMTLASDRGWKVERRQVDIDELAEFEEIGACGTAVIITAVSRVVVGEKVVTIGDKPDVVGPRLRMLYEHVRAIQYGEVLDRHQWCDILPL